MPVRYFKRVACVDFETFYSKDYTLRKLSDSEYVRDPRFKVTAVGIQRDDEEYARVYHGRDAKRALQAIDWSETAFLAHKCHFDAFILAERYGIVPCFFLDTLSMARALHGNLSHHDLATLAKIYGLDDKDKEALHLMRGVEDIDTLAPDVFERFINYTARDVETTFALFDRLATTFPISGLRLIDLTILMFARPRIYIQQDVAQRVYDSEIEKKLKLLERAGVTREQLGSTPQFVELLRAAGVEPESKISPRTGLSIPAISMQDVSFKALREHPDEQVRNLVEARIAVKSALLETRSGAMVRRAKVNKLFPVFLKPYGAHTMRWSGSDKVNPQNLVRGSGLREALAAPRGHSLNIADSSQIEARVNAWRSGQRDILETFRARKDVYKYTASRAIYHKPEAEITKDERFVGKTCVLGLGYGMGAKKFKHTLKIGQFGPPVDMEYDQCKMVVDAWRATNMAIVANWRLTEDMARAAFLGEREMNDGLLIFEGFKGDGYIHMPNGLYLRYHHVRLDGEGQLVYQTRYGPTRIWGGYLVENIVQCLAYIVVSEQMLHVQEEVDCEIVTCTHDEIVALSRDSLVEKNQRKIIEIMSRPPVWAPDLPLGAAGGTNKIYVKPE